VFLVSIYFLKTDIVLRPVAWLYL